MKFLPLALLCAPLVIAAQQQVRPFAPNRFDYTFAGSQVGIAASGQYTGNSVDLLSITAALRIINNFVASDVLLIGGLIPGDRNVVFQSRGRGAAFGGLSAGRWRLGVSAEAATYAVVRLPVTAANLLRIGNIARASIDTRDMMARGLVTRELGVTVGRRTRAGPVTIDVGVNTRHVAPVYFAAGRIDPLRGEPALMISGDTISAHADIVHSEGRADGGGVAVDFYAGINLRQLQASVIVSDVGSIRVVTHSVHRAVDLRDHDLQLFAEHVKHTNQTIVNESNTLSLPYRIETHLVARLNRWSSAGLFYRNQSAGDVGADDSAIGLSLGWNPGNVVDARLGIARVDSERWTVLAGTGFEFGRVFVDIDFDADGLRLERARGINGALSFGVRF